MTWAEGGSDAAAQANNPRANNTAFDLRNFYIGELTDSDNSANQFWFRFAKPFGRQFRLAATRLTAD